MVMDGTIHDPHQHLDSGKKEIISVYLVIKINDVDFLVILTIVKRFNHYHFYHHVSYFSKQGGEVETTSMNGFKVSNVLHHLKIIIDSHIAFIRVFQVDLKPVFAGGGESVDIFQANHSFT